MQSYLKTPWLLHSRAPVRWPHMNARKEHIQAIFTPLEGEHRLEVVGTKDGVQYINNSFATNINAAWYALESMPPGRVVHWLAGGQDVDSADAWRAIVDVARAKVKAVYDADPSPNRGLAEALRPYFDLPGTPYLSIRHAVLAARAMAEPGDIILLNPGCSSLHRYDNYMQRGEIFKQAYAEL